MPPAVQDDIRATALQAILDWRADKPVALPEPSPDLLARMLTVSMAEDLPENFGENIAAGPGIDPHARQTARLSVPPGFCALIVGTGVSAARPRRPPALHKP